MKKVTNVTVSVPALRVGVGDKETLTATARDSSGATVDTARVTFDSSGATLDTARVTFDSSDEAIATVDAHGVITGVKPGTTQINARADGIRAECQVTVA